MSSNAVLLDGHPFTPYRPPRFSDDEMLARVQAFGAELQERRSVRFFSPDPVPAEVVEEAIRAAGSAPSGAHLQPWRFVLIGDPAVKAKIREAAEKEEYESYNGRMPEEWLEVLKPLQTDWRKEFLEVAPWLIVVFRIDWSEDEEGRRRKHYYVAESVGLAAGMLIAALHRAGLQTLTHTPSPMGFLREILGRPSSEKPFLLLPVGYAADDALVPDLQRKSLDEILTRI